MSGSLISLWCRKTLPVFPLSLITLSLISVDATAELYFDPSMISGDPAAIADLSSIFSAGAQLPGIYQVDIFLNGSNIASSRAVRFSSLKEWQQSSGFYSDSATVNAIDTRDKTGLIACLTLHDLKEMGVNTSINSALSSLSDNSTCLSPARYIDQAYTSFDFQKMRLDVSIPQAALIKRPRGWISPELWDEGVNAALTGYRFSGSENYSRHGGNSRNLYLNLNNGINIGAWRLRDNRTWSGSSNDHGSNSKWTRLNTYAERAIIPWQSQFTVGESSTGGDIFDSFSFRGVQLATDEGMYPDTQRGFAPTIKGIALSNAKVSIRQNGAEIYQTFVPPGAFVINDLYPLSSGGDLNVIVTESDGRSRVFTVPYSSVSVLQREGTMRYTAAAGSYRSNSDNQSDPTFFTSTLLWGLPYNVTTYGGTLFADNYRSAALGAGINMGRMGAFSADITHADSVLADDNKYSGQSLRFQYARSLDAIGTTLQLVGYRYSTQGFYTLNDTAQTAMSGRNAPLAEMVDENGKLTGNYYYEEFNLKNTRRARLTANISQQIGDNSSLYLTGTRQTYWHVDETEDSFQVGYGSSIGPVNYNISYSHSQVIGRDEADKQAYLSLSVPLDKLLGGRSNSGIQANYSLRRDSQANLSHQAGLSGTTLENNNLSWNVQQGYSRQESNTGSASLDYRGGYASSQLGYSYGDGYRQVNYGLTGGAVMHRNGVTFGQYPGATNVLIAAPGASNVLVESGSGIRTDWRGYALVPYSTAYRENRVALNIGTLDKETEIDTTTSRVIPTRGALARADFKARTGQRALITLMRNGKPLPFGTSVSAEGAASIVGDEGQVYLSGLAPKGQITAQWGSGSDQQCKANYQLPEKSADVALVRIGVQCF